MVLLPTVQDIEGEGRTKIAYSATKLAKFGGSACRSLPVDFMLFCSRATSTRRPNDIFAAVRASHLAPRTSTFPNLQHITGAARPDIHTTAITADEANGAGDTPSPSPAAPISTPTSNMADAKSSLNPASVEFARSLELESIPEKLRCATCNRLAIHAVKLGCCDSTICGECNDSLSGDSCPVCEHSPFSPDLVSPAKSLQTTVKVFIKNEAKKRGIDLTGNTPKPLAPAAAAFETPPVAAATLTLAESGPAPTPAVEGDAGAAIAPEEAAPSAELGAASEQELDTAPADGDLESAGEKAQDAEQDEDDDDDDDVVITTERPENEEQQYSAEGDQQYNNQANGESENTNQNMQMDQQQQQDFNNFNQGMNGFGNNNFGNMNMNGFNPMMGMPNFMAMPNMMGMNMDPSMMFGGNFGGMGDMSAMMGMGMGNMGGGMSGMGDFNGMNGPGFFPNQGNYMQSQNFGNGPRSNDFYNNRGYGRGYGRGFGRGARGNQYGRGRGSWQYQQQQQYGNHSQFAQ
ncbi:uncharacterized protein MYCFIDRAFT_214809, partial [Pseudocercospora fijiensis CIRAD86]